MSGEPAAPSLPFLIRDQHQAELGRPELSRGRWLGNSCIAFCTPFLACVALAFYLLATNKDSADRLVDVLYNVTQLARSDCRPS